MTLSLGTGLALGRTSRPPEPADAAGAPELLVAPGLSGDGRIGGLLAVDPGLWRAADRLDLLWLRDAAPIAGATSATYAPTPQDDRARIACRVTAWAGARSRAAQTPEIPIAFAPPRPVGALPDLDYTQYTGFHIVDASPLFSGASLSFSVSGPGVSVDPATGVVTIGSDALLSGAAIVVTARNSGGEAEIGFTLKVTPAEAPGPVAPALLAAPRLDGAGLVGAPLVVDPGLWSGDPAPDLWLQWLCEGASIAGAIAGSFTPGAAEDACAVSCRVTAANAAGAVSAETPAIMVVRPAPEAVGALSDVVLALGGAGVEIPAAGVFAGAGLIFAAAGAGASIDPETGVVALTAAATRDGEIVTVTARNSGGAAEIAFAVTVLAAPQALGAPADLAFPVGSGAQATGVAAFFAGADLVFALEAAPAGVTIDAATGVVAIPTATALSGAIVVRASNAVGAAEVAFSVTVLAAPQALGAPADLAFPVGSGAQATGVAAFFAGADLVFALEAAPAGVTIDAATGVVAIPTATALSGAIVVRASNAVGAAEVAFSVTVLAAAQALGAPADLAFPVGSGAQAAGVAAFFAGADLVFALEAAPAGVTIDAATGVVTVPTATALSGAIVVRASNAVGAAEVAFSVTVLAAPQALGAPADLAFPVGSGAQATGVAAFFAGADLVFALEAAPAGVTIDAATGVVAIPTATALSGAIVVRASNAVGAAEVAFSVTVLAAAQVAAPTTVGSPSDAVFALGTGPQTVSAQAFFAGADLVFSLDAAPAGVTINPGSGLVTTPTDAAVSGLVTVRAANAGGAAQASFQLTVRALATVFDDPARLADVDFLQLVAPPSWDHDAAIPAAVLSPGRVSDTAHGDWTLGRGDGRYRALVKINHSASDIGAYSRSRPFGLNGRMSFADGNWRGVRVELDRRVSGATAFEIREYDGSGANQTLLGSFPAAWDYDVWCWVEAEFEAGTVRARTYPEGATAPDWQAVAQISTPDAGFFGPMSQTFAAKIWPILRLRRLEFQPIARIPAAALDAQWTLEQIEAQQ